MVELKIVLQAAGYALLGVLALHGIVRIISRAYFRSKHEYLRRIHKDG